MTQFFKISYECQKTYNGAFDARVWGAVSGTGQECLLSYTTHATYSKARAYALDMARQAGRNHNAPVARCYQ